MPTLGDVESYVTTLQSNNPSIGACRRLSSTVYNWLVNVGAPAGSVTVVQGRFMGEDGGAEHFYVRVEPDVLTDTAVIIDPTVSQFTEENWYDNTADTWVPPGEIPDIGVITPSQRIFSRYE